MDAALPTHPLASPRRRALRAPGPRRAAAGCAAQAIEGLLQLAHPTADRLGEAKLRLVLGDGRRDARVRPDGERCAGGMRSPRVAFEASRKLKLVGLLLIVTLSGRSAVPSPRASQSSAVRADRFAP
jgi:hypothetical protein